MKIKFKNQKVSGTMPRYLALALLLMTLSLFSNAAEISSDLCIGVTTDKACYNAGGEVTFTITDGTLPANARIRYRHGSEILSTQEISGDTWKWQAPEADFKGYLAEIFTTDGTAETIIATIAIDVSSHWGRFPRYGFVADFEEYGDNAAKKARIAEEIKYLNRLHINGVQFQDWHWKHHRPVKFEENGALTQWYQDVSNRWVGTEHVKGYITESHKYGMKAIFYNLCFGAWENAEADGVKPEWGLFRKDGENYVQDVHGLPDSWQSSIYLQNPGNAEWQQYIIERNKEVYDNYDFDGYQIDQLGYRADKLYDYNHNEISLTEGYGSFIAAMKAAHPEKDLIMNAVSGYGADYIAKDHVAFCYDEMWSGEASFGSLLDKIKENDRFSNNTRGTVFAAYMNYDMAGNPANSGKFMNLPGVLLTDAVMFALGGSHLEMGDHMLDREYFPDHTLKVSPELKEALVRYYDFLTGYQNLLRGENSSATFSAEVSTPAGYNIVAWPPREYSITTFAKKVDNCEVVHFLNFLNTADLDWRDLNGTRPAPEVKANIPVTIVSDHKISKVWVASPDLHAGAVIELPFTQNGRNVSFTIPSLEYWTMAVMETEDDAEDFIRITGPAVTGWNSHRDGTVWMVKEAPNVFKASVYIKANEDFKFLAGDGDSWECTQYSAQYDPFKFTSDYNTAGLNRRLWSDGNDFKFQVDQDGNYCITVDLNSMTIRCDRLSYQDSNLDCYPAFYAVGDYNGWNLATAVALTPRSESEPYMLTAMVNLTAGELKFATRPVAGDWGQPMMVRDAANEGKYVLYDGDDRKWTINEGGLYLIEINKNDLTVSIKRHQEISIGNSCFAIFSTPYNLDFSGVNDIDAYVATSVKRQADDQTKIELKRITFAPSGTPMVLFGTPGSHNIPFGSAMSLGEENVLVSVWSNTTVSADDGDNRNYIFSDGKFRAANGDEVPALQAFLALPKSQSEGINELNVILPEKQFSAVRLTGEAFDSYDLGKSVFLVKDDDVNVFSGLVYLEGGKHFKFVTQFGGWADAPVCLNAEYTDFTFNNDITKSNMLYEYPGGNDRQFMVAESGNYNVRIDIDKMRIYVERDEYQEQQIDRYPALYVFGDYCDWDLTGVTRLTAADAANPHILSATIEMQAGNQFKLSTQKLEYWSQTMMVPDDGDATTFNVWDGTDAGDRKWSVERTSEYLITVDKIARTISITDLQPVASKPSELKNDGRTFTINFLLDGVKYYDGVLYARTTEKTENPSEPATGHAGFDSYEDGYHLDNFTQRDWVAIEGLVGFEGIGIASGFKAVWNGARLIPQGEVAARVEQVVTFEPNIFGVCNIFYGSYNNMGDDFMPGGYKPFFVQAKENEVATFVGMVNDDHELVGSGVAGKLNGRGVKVEGNSPLEPTSDYIQFDGILVRDEAANGGYKVLRYGDVTVPTGVGKVTDSTPVVYATYGTVVIKAKACDRAEIYNAAGCLITVATVADETPTTVSLPAGYYIVRLAGRATPVLVR